MNIATTNFPPLELENRTVVDTATAAFHIGRKPQTLRSWACFENGPIRPIRINGRLAWPVRELRRLLGSRPFPKQTQSHDDLSSPFPTFLQGAPL